MPDPMDTLSARLSELNQVFQDRLQNDDVQKKAFDQLYEELRAYKEDFLFQAEKPFLLDLLLFYDSLLWFHQSIQKEPMSPEVLQETVQYLVDELLELLYRRDVVPTEPTERFDRRVHKAVKVVPTARATDDWKVIAVSKRGFMRGNRLLRPEEVSVSRVGGDSVDNKE